MSTRKQHTIIDTARQLGDDLVETGRTVVNAGFGAVSLVEERTRETFDELVERGQKYDPADNRVVSEARRFGRDVESRVQDTVGKTLNRAGVPSRDELRMLIDRVEVLTAKVDEMASKRVAKS